MRILNSSLAALVMALMLSPVALSQSEEAAEQQCFSLEGTSDYYFGEIDPDLTVEHNFVFKNNCSETVEIAQARASCGCTAAVISEKTVPPGGQAEIQVKFTPPRGSRGKVTKTVSLYLKDNDKPHTVIRFSAKIKTDVEIHPAYVQLLGFQVGDDATGKVEVKNVSEEPLEISSISINMTTYADTSGDGRTIAMPLQGAKVSPSSMTLKPGEARMLEVSLIPVFKGQVNGAVRLKTNKSEAIIQVFGVIRERENPTLRQSDAQGRVLNPDTK